MAAREDARPSRSESAGCAHARCEAAGLALTESRRLILDVVLDLGTHPTADEVHAEATRRQPGIGRATVYRALEAFVGAGVLTKAAHPGAAVRYDGAVDPHHHMVCSRCNRILDFTDRDLDALRVPDTSKWDFVVSDVQVVLRGLCQQCIETEEESTP